MKLTLEEIEAGKTENGGYTKETLLKWGVNWPPPKGWKGALLAGDPIENVNPLEKESHPYSVESDLLHDVVMAVISSGHGDVLLNVDALAGYYGGHLPAVRDFIDPHEKIQAIEGGITLDDRVFRFSVARRVK